MTSDRKIKANRAYAWASTGPRTAQGRARAAKNALRHGLSLPVRSNPALTEEVETLAREIAGRKASPELLELARQVAEAEIDLRRVRYARYQLLSRGLKDPHYEPRALTRKKLAVIGALLKKKDVPESHLLRIVNFRPPSQDKLAAISSEELKRCVAMDRYERRALSRRKFAIRNFDEARRQAVESEKPCEKSEHRAPMDSP